jgi:hypothetical protein
VNSTPPATTSRVDQDTVFAIECAQCSLYHPSENDSLSLDHLLDSHVATFLTGPRAGSSLTYVTTPPLSPTWVWSGTYSPDRKTLLLNNGDTLSKVRSSTGSEVYVICQLERVLTRLTP